MNFTDLTGDIVFDYIKKGLNVELTGCVVHHTKHGLATPRSEIFVRVGLATLLYNYGKLKRQLLADAKYGKHYGL